MSIRVHLSHPLEKHQAARGLSGVEGTPSEYPFDELLRHCGVLYPERPSSRVSLADFDVISRTPLHGDHCIAVSELQYSFGLPEKFLNVQPVEAPRNSRSGIADCRIIFVSIPGLLFCSSSPDSFTQFPPRHPIMRFCVKFGTLSPRQPEIHVKS